MEDFIRHSCMVWNGLKKGFSSHSQQVLPPWDLLAEHVMHDSEKPTSHAALCAAAFFGQGMVVMPTPQDLSVTWQQGGGSFNLHCIPNAPDAAKRYLIAMLLQKCDSAMIMRMRVHVNETFSQTKRRPLPQFEMLYDLLKRELGAAAKANDTAAFADMGTVASAMAAVSRLRICPVSP